MTYFVKGKKVVKDDDGIMEFWVVTQVEEKSLELAKILACAALIKEDYDTVDLYDSSAFRIFGIKRC